MAQHTAPTHNGVHPPDWLPQSVHKIEDMQGLDRARALLASLSKPIEDQPALFDTLRGKQIGHALHPLLSDLPIGAWTSAMVLDLFGGKKSRRASTMLVAFGLLTAAPTAVTGLAEWRSADAESQRVGVVHSAANSAGLLLYSASLWQRLRGRHVRGVATGMLGGALVSVGGYLGGHLAVNRKVGTAEFS